MAALLKNVVLVSLLASSCLAWENLPSIPAGRRAEYYLQHDDGSYKFGYDTGAGQSAKVDADAANEVQGQFSYINNDGKQVSLKYSAGGAGFVPELDGIPAPVAAPGSRAGPAAPIGSGIAPVGAPSQEGGGGIDADYDANADASYNFNIDTDSYKRTESSDARGNIRGEYSYNSKEGGSHGLSYAAGEGTGFVVTGGIDAPAAGAPGAPGAAGSYSGPAAPSIGSPDGASPSSAILNPDGSYSFSFSTADQSREESADAKNNVRGSFSFREKDDGQTRRVDYSAGADTGFVATGAHLPVAPSAEASGVPGVPAAAGVPGAPITPFAAAPALPSSPLTPYSGPAANTEGEINPDGSYSFSFSTADQSREESADAQNNVRGSYSFRAKDDGQTRRVDYSAGAATGFVASGSHLPVAPSAGAPGESGSPLAPVVPGAPINGYSAPAPIAPSSPITSYTGPASNAQSTLNPDGSYSFSFSTDEQTREESADSKNNVRGSYSFRAKDDGQTRLVDYSAGADTGFVATGAHLPVAPSAGAPGAPSVPGIPSIYSASGSPITPGSPASNAQGVTNPDGSYSFSFNTDDQSRQESADAQNNVRGSFSFKAKDDGLTRTVDYEAGAATGFIARGSHLPVAPSPGTPGSPASPEIGAPSAGSGVPYSGSGTPGASSSSAREDGSYSFSYNTGDQSRDESGDSQGNVRGSFSFVAKDDGLTRRVDYEAGAEKGFIAKGAHLPVAPSGTPAGAGLGAGAGAGLGAGIGAGAGVGPISTYQGPVAGTGSDDGQDNGDASYSYSYETDSSSKSESSDTQGNVQGQFTFLGGDGVTRKLTYTSKGEDGFIADGDHLPKAPVAGIAPVGGVVSPLSPIVSVARNGGGVLISPIVPASIPGHVKSVDIIGPGFVLNQYLPPQHKTGYIFDSKA